MQKEYNLKSFNLYNFLKHQNADSFHNPYFLADKHTYKNAHVNFPFRTFTYGLGITYSGQGDVFRIGSADYVVKAGCLTTVGPGMVCQWTGNYTADHDTVYFTEELFTGIQTGSFLQAMPFFFHGGKHVITLTDDQTGKMAALFGSLKELKDQHCAVPGIVYAMLMLAGSFHSKLEGQLLNSTVSKREKITNAFRKLVAEHFPEHKEVAYYANELHITPKYLSEVLQVELGKTAKTLIDEYVIMEAKSLLKQTSLSIQEICYWLGFEDASHFNKFFKKLTDTTPGEYRRRL
ncbi:helix-turn-helix domain-containing protein [Dyadobacter sp. LJ53]|uniref:helix-turn-helix domain-containing protein n=1 Tax=Dyadobacter chenwenxiniae TaxID=2906456 RepID=UPI001F300F5D|nr:helix-turn-helix domain-containing protein [Dyadobacter chenwenxiniae]MCF0048461.1 helix-turn-helix domain-containing protein [Dyadobacter chenwenxiniae]